MNAVGAKGVPKGGVAIAGIDIGVDIDTARLAARGNAVKAIGEHIGAISPENHHRGKLDTCGQRVGIVGNEVVVDVRPHLGAGIGNESIQGNRLTVGNTMRRLRRKTGS